jgi:DNA end-binding protein Ku
VLFGVQHDISEGNLKGSEERKSADVIDLTELLKRSLAGKPVKKAAAKKTTKAS